VLIFISQCKYVSAQGLGHARNTLWGVTLPEDVARQEVENTATLAYAHEEVEGLVQKVTLLEGEPAKACRA
jgi:hypothetical protein